MLLKELNESKLPKRTVKLLYTDSLGNKTVVMVNDSKVWAFGANQSLDRGQPHALSTFMFMDNSGGGYAAKDKKFKEALLVPMKETPEGDTGYAADVLEAAIEVTKLSKKDWKLLAWG